MAHAPMKRYQNATAALKTVRDQVQHTAVHQYAPGLVRLAQKKRCAAAHFYYLEPVGAFGADFFQNICGLDRVQVIALPKQHQGNAP